MEQLFLLDERSFGKYVSMIPQELLAEWESNTDMQIFGISSWGEPAGIIVIESDGADALLRFIYLSEDLRGQGIAARAVVSLMYDCYMDGVGHLCAKYISQQYPDAERLFSGFAGSTEEEEVGSFYISLDELSGIDMLKKASKGSISLTEIGQNDLNHLQDVMKESGWDMGLLPIDRREYSPASAVYRSGSGAEAIMLIKEKIDGGILIPLLVSFSENPLAVLDMMSFAVQRGLELYPKETEIEFHVITPAMLRFLEKTFDRKAWRRIKKSIDLGVFNKIMRDIEDRISE